MESALMTMPPSSRARRAASADLPLAVGPAITRTGCSLCVPPLSLISALAMEFVLSLISSPDAAELTPALLDRVNHGLAAANAKARPVIWLDPERAAEWRCTGDAAATLAELRRR